MMPPPPPPPSNHPQFTTMGKTRPSHHSFPNHHHIPHHVAPLITRANVGKRSTREERREEKTGGGGAGGGGGGGGTPVWMRKLEERYQRLHKKIAALPAYQSPASRLNLLTRKFLNEALAKKAALNNNSKERQCSRGSSLKENEKDLFTSQNNQKSDLNEFDENELNEKGTLTTRANKLSSDMQRGRKQSYEGLSSSDSKKSIAKKVENGRKSEVVNLKVENGRDREVVNLHSRFPCCCSQNVNHCMLNNHCNFPARRCLPEIVNSKNNLPELESELFHQVSNSRDVCKLCWKFRGEKTRTPTECRKCQTESNSRRSRSKGDKPAEVDESTTRDCVPCPFYDRHKSAPSPLSPSLHHHRHPCVSHTHSARVSSPSPPQPPTLNERRTTTAAKTQRSLSLPQPCTNHSDINHVNSPRAEISTNTAADYNDDNNDNAAATAQANELTKRNGAKKEEEGKKKKEKEESESRESELALAVSLQHKRQVANCCLHHQHHHYYYNHHHHNRFCPTTATTEHKDWRRTSGFNTATSQPRQHCVCDSIATTTTTSATTPTKKSHGPSTSSTKRISSGSVCECEIYSSISSQESVEVGVLLDCRSCQHENCVSCITNCAGFFDKNMGDNRSTPNVLLRTLNPIPSSAERGSNIHSGVPATKISMESAKDLSNGYCVPTRDASGDLPKRHGTRGGGGGGGGGRKGGRDDDPSKEGHKESKEKGGGGGGGGESGKTQLLPQMSVEARHAINQTLRDMGSVEGDGDGEGEEEQFHPPPHPQDDVEVTDDLLDLHRSDSNTSLPSLGEPLPAIHPQQHPHPHPHPQRRSWHPNDTSSTHPLPPHPQQQPSRENSMATSQKATTCITTNTRQKSYRSTNTLKQEQSSTTNSGVVSVVAVPTKSARGTKTPRRSNKRSSGSLNNTTTSSVHVRLDPKSVKTLDTDTDVADPEGKLDLDIASEGSLTNNNNNNNNKDKDKSYRSSPELRQDPVQRMHLPAITSRTEPNLVNSPRRDNVNYRHVNYRIKGVGSYKVARENTFEITAPDFDIRYREVITCQRGDRETPPPEVFEKSVGKVRDWLNKYYSYSSS